MKPLRYLCQDHGIRLDRPVKASCRWVHHIPGVYHAYVLNEEMEEAVRQEEGSLCLATIRHVLKPHPDGSGDFPFALLRYFSSVSSLTRR